jgi:hypothetical protein
MAPEITKETDIRELFFSKFLRYGETIIYEKISFEDGDPKEHLQIAREYKRSSTVDDGGYIDPPENYLEDESKIRFRSTTTSCDIEGNKREQRKETIRIAKQILGEEKVDG